MNYDSNLTFGYLDERRVLCCRRAELCVGKKWKAVLKNMVFDKFTVAEIVK